MRGKDGVGKLASSLQNIGDIPTPKEGLKKLQEGLSLTNITNKQECATTNEFPSSDYASLCLLSYERPDFLDNTLKSLADQPGYDYELLIHDDGSQSPDVRERLIAELYAHKKASTVIF